MGDIEEKPKPCGNGSSAMATYSHNSAETASSEKTEPPNGGFGWAIVFAAFMLHIIAPGVGYTLGVYYPHFQDLFQSDASTTAWVAAAHLAVLFCSGPLAGWLLGKIGTSAVAFLGGLLTGIGCIAAGYSNSIYLVILSLGVVSGIGCGFVFISSVTAVSRWFSTKRSLAIGIAVSGVGFGIFAFAPLIRLLLNNYGHDGALLIEGALGFQGCVFALMLRPVPKSSAKMKIRPSVSFRKNKDVPLKVYTGPHQNYTLLEKNASGIFEDELATPLYGKKRKDSQNSSASGILSSPRFTSVAGILKSLSFWLFVASQFLTFLSASGPLVFLYNRAVKDLSVDVMKASYIVSIMGLTNTLGRFSSGAVGNRFPKGRLFMLSAAIMTFGLATTLSVFGSSFASIAAFAAIFGFGYGGMFALTSVVLVDLFGLELMGTIYGDVGVFRGIACLIGPPFGGWLITATGNRHTWLFVLTGLLGFLGGAVLLLIPLSNAIRKKRGVHTKAELKN